MEREASGKVRGSLLFGGSPRKMEERTDNSEQQRPEFPRRHRKRPQASHQGRDAGKDQGIPGGKRGIRVSSRNAEKHFPALFPDRRTAAHPAIPPQSAAAPKKPGRSGMPFLPHTAANPRRHPAAPDSPGTTNPVKFPSGGSSPGRAMWLWQSAPALFRPGTMKKSGKSVTAAVSPSLPASQCWQSCC